MPTFERDGNFKEIVLHGKAVAVRAGKRGTAGQVTATTYATARAARAAYEKLLDANRGGDAAPVADNTELLAAIAKQPDDDALRMVYADWLQAAGNPHGELIALQAKPKLSAKAKRLIDKHPEWLGALGERLASLSKYDAKDVRFEWHLGFLRAIELRSASVDADLIEQITRLPVARFTQELVLGGTDNYRKVVTVLAKAGWPAGIEKLSIGHQRWGEHLPSANHCGDILAAIAKYPRLRELDITPGGSKLDGLDMPAMRRFTLRDPTPNQLAAIAKAKWPALERLGLRLIENRYIAIAADLKLAAPNLRELDIHVWRDDQIASLIANLPKAALLRGIERVRVVADKPYAKQLATALPNLAVECVGDDADP